MQPLTRTLWLLHGNEQLARSFALLPGQPYRLNHLTTWDDLHDALRRSPPAAITIVDPYRRSDGGAGLATELQALLREFPSATVVAALQVTPGDSVVLRTLGEWGVADCIDLARENTPPAVARRLRVVQSRPVQRLINRALPRGLPSRPAGLLLRAAEIVAVGGQAPDLARALGVGMRTVPRWCHRADLPPPQRLLAWLRLLLAADLLDDPSRSLESVARATGYASGPSLKTAIRNLMRTTPGELREKGAFATAASAFERELFDLRARHSGKPPKVWLS